MTHSRSMLGAVGFVLWCGVAAVCSLHHHPAHAQPSNNVREVQLTQTQQELLESAVAADKQKDYTSAIEYLRASLRLGESDVVYINLGRILFRLARCQEAAEAYMKVPLAPHLKVTGGQSREELLAIADRYFADLKRECPAELTVICEPANMSIRVEGQLAQPCNGRMTMDVPAGQHKVMGSYLGQELTEVVMFSEGLETTSLRLTFEPDMKLAAARQAVAEERYDEAIDLLRDHPINNEEAWQVGVTALFGASRCEQAAQRLERGLRRTTPGRLTPERLEESLGSFDPGTVGHCALVMDGLREAIEAENALPATALWGWGMLGTGAGLLVLGVVLDQAWLGPTLNDLEDVGAQGDDRNQFDSLQSEANTARVIVISSLAAGGAAIAVGAALTVMGYQAREEAAADRAGSIVVVPWGGQQQGGVQLQLQW
ncbi:MAG: hypothetical protein AAFS10_25480 [Myxococcota bacterium]